MIWQSFRSEIEPALATPQPMPLDELEAIEQMGLAIYRLARQQRALEARLDTVEDAVWQVDERTRLDVERLRSELNALELRVAPTGRSDVISEVQAAELSQAVKSVALAQGRQSGRNEFGAIYGELYRRYGITSYRNLRAHQFADAMAWLDQWFHHLTAADRGQAGE